MTIKYGINKRLQIVLAGLLSWLGVNIFTIKTLAQQSNIVPDNTLGAESSQVINNFQGQPIELITGGATRGINLFHSFQEFNISAGRGAYFFNSNPEIQNILARVTGGSPSEILGTLGTFSESKPNLFLMNPNGIIFGQNASLDVDGSFAATTANVIQFGEKGNFSATNPETPQLLTINPSAFLFNQINKSASIQINAATVGLEVPYGKSLLLVGGNTNIDAGSLFAPSGRIELGGLAEPGKIEIWHNDNIIGLYFPLQVELADVLLNNAYVDVRANGGGDIAINSRNTNILGRSFVLGGTYLGLGTTDSKAGDVRINATGNINIKDRSIVGNSLGFNAVGQGGNVSISTGSLSVTNGSQLIANSLGNGDAGNVIINANDKVSFDGNRSGIISSTESPQAVGNSGDIQITTGSLFATNGAQFVASALGQGKAGNIIINARDNVSLDKSAAFSRLRLGAVGQGGDIKISTNSLSMTNNAQLTASTLGQGNAGNVIINARETVSLDGDNTSIYSDVEEKAVGRGGNIQISTGSLSATNGVQLLARTYGQGDAGNVTINTHNTQNTVLFDAADILSTVEKNAVGKGGNIEINTGSLLVKNGARLTTTTVGRGDAGNVILNARDSIFFDGISQDGTSPTIASTALEAEGVGKSGDIRITTGSLSVTNGAQFSAATVGRGDAGNIIIDARGSVTFDGTDSNSIFPSGALSAVDRDVSVGKGGDIRITADSLAVTNGAQVVASTRGQGDAGDVIINTRDTVFVDGASKDGFYTSSLRSTVRGDNAVGKGGDIRITTGSLSVKNGGIVVTSTFGKGDAGNIRVNASNDVNLFGSGSVNGVSSGLFTFNTASSIGGGGNILVEAPLFRISSGAVLDARTENESKGGNITVNAGLFEALNGGQLITTTSGIGHAGNITVNVIEKTTVSGSDANFNERLDKFKNDDDIRNVSAASGLFVRSEGSGDAGDIKINNAQQLTIQDGGRIEASTLGEGKGGNIDVISDVIDLLGTSYDGKFTSGLFSDTTGAGLNASAGDITVNTRVLSLKGGASISTSTAGQSQAGNITLTGRETVNLSGNATLADGQNVASGLFTLTQGSGAAGNIKVIDTGKLFIENEARVSASTYNDGKGGSINVNTESLDINSNGGIFATSTGMGAAGNININTNQRLSMNDSYILTTSIISPGGSIDINSAKMNMSGSSNISTFSVLSPGGNVNITAKDIRLFDNSNISTFSALSSGGNVNITANSILAFDNSDIFAFAPRGQGGNITLNTPAFFGESYRPASGISDLAFLLSLSSNNRVDVNATGAVSGVVSEPDTSFVQNSLNKFPQNFIDTNMLISNSCIARGAKRQENSFTVTGSGALPNNRPNDTLVSNYTTGEVRGASTSLPWKKGDAIIEPQGVYRLTNGQLLLSRECSG